MIAIDLIIEAEGAVRCIYTDELPLSAIGILHISRGSHVEPNAEGQWLADLGPVGGPTLGPFLRRGDALAAELQWLHENWLSATRSQT